MDTEGKIGIDMLNVDKADALVVELVDGDGDNFVITIDGGNRHDGPTVVQHLNQHHAGRVNIAVSTHADQDHIGGIPDILDNCKVDNLIFNDPEKFAQRSSIVAFAERNLSSDRADLIKASLQGMDGLRAAASRNGVPVYSHFSNNPFVHRFAGWTIALLGPSQDLFSEAWTREESSKHWIKGDLPDDVGIDDPSIDTTPINNASVILLIEGYGNKYLFTGDAGKRGLREAAAVADISNLHWLDVPHHGSRRNIDTKLANHLAPSKAFVSSPGSDKHPRRAVIGALQNAGADVYSTCRSGSLYHHPGLSGRDGYTTASPWERVGTASIR